MLISSQDCSRGDNKMRWFFYRNRLFTDDSVEPTSINSVFLELFGLQKLHEIFNSGTDLPANFNLLQCQNKSLTGLLTCSSLGKKMTKLRICKFVDSTIRSNTEVAPAVRGRLKLDSFNGSRSWLESLIRILSSDTSSNDVRLDGSVFLLKEINLVGSINVFFSVQTANLWNIVQGNTHGNLKLSGRHIHFSNTFCDRVLHLKTRIKFQEKEFSSIRIEEILNSSSPLVSNALGQTLGSLFHLTESLPGCNDGRALLKNLLETTLGRAITSVQSNSISILISNNLHFQVARILT
mmetsp:Transcript_14219/g.26667  ORF Transcript_14219/g.26667 Transcript_14219/m.26667 type:complete len:294 (-) Transcript_14219:484-1365(-)